MREGVGSPNDPGGGGMLGGCRLAARRGENRLSGGYPEGSALKTRSGPILPSTEPVCYSSGRLLLTVVGPLACLARQHVFEPFCEQRVAILNC